MRSAPPEPPTSVLSGAPYVEKGGVLLCRVPGCTTPNKEFKKRHAVAIHLARRHGLDLEGKYLAAAPKAEPEADVLKSVSVRDVLVGSDNISLMYQAIRIVERAKENLSGKLNEHDVLKKKAVKLDLILLHMRELMPSGGGPPG